MILNAGKSSLGPINWQYIVIDEAHRLKNKDCKLLAELKQFKFEHLLLLTGFLFSIFLFSLTSKGTPLQNNIEELWTLLNFLDPSDFPNPDEFLEQFGELKDAEQVKKLHEVLRPYLVSHLSHYRAHNSSFL